MPRSCHLFSLTGVTMSTILAIDPSLNSTGVAFRLADGNVQALCISPSSRRGLDRIRYVRDVVDTLLNTYSPELVVYEDYAYAFRGKSNALFSLGELGGVLKLLLWESGVDILLVPPTSLKLFATGSGAAKKPEVGLALRAHLGVSFKSDDQNDAAWLLLLGESWRNPRILPRDRRHSKRRAVSGCSFIEAI